MKRTLYILGLLVGLSSFTSDQRNSDSLLPDKTLLHIGIVVRDIDYSIDEWMKLWDVKRPEITIATGHEANPTTYQGERTDAKAKLAFIRLDNITIELIQPMGDDPSHWWDFLNDKGPGVHHVAFKVKGLRETYLDAFNENGFPVLQKGGWATGEYAYMDGSGSLGVMIELLENYNK